MNIDMLIDDVIGREGAYSNNPADSGGATRWGVTEREARANGYTGDMRDFPRETAIAIYRSKYWTRPAFDQVAAVAPIVAAELFDTGVNMGVLVASQFLQRALNVLNRGASDYGDMEVDGHLGPVSIAALKAYMAKRGKPGEAVLVKVLDSLQGSKYVDLAEHRQKDEAFVFGWFANRIGQAA